MAQPDPHDWHMFDAEKGYEVARTLDGWAVRLADSESGEITVLTDEEFEQWRRTGSNPKGLL